MIILNMKYLAGSFSSESLNLFSGGDHTYEGRTESHEQQFFVK